MLLSDAPVKVVVPFAAQGNKNVIPVPSQIPITPGAASWTDGFPPLTMMDPVDGGVGPKGFDFNGVLNALSALTRWFNAGAGFIYDAAFSATIAGYPLGARVLRADHSGYWLNVVDQNTTNPDTGGAGWVIDGVKATSSVFASAQQTLAVGNSKVMFDSVEFDSGLWDAANKRFLAPIAGKYRVTGAIHLNSPSGQDIATQIWKSGVFVKQCIAFPQVTDQNLAFPFDVIVNCAAGDFIEVFLGITQTPVLAGIAGNNQPYVFAQCEYLG